MSSDKSRDPLQDYFDSLLHDSPLDSALAARHCPVDETEPKLAAGGNIAALSSMSRPARTVPARAYAEPIRTLNLRMPLPPIAAPVVEQAPDVERVQVAEAAPIAVAVPVAATESRVEAAPLDVAPVPPASPAPIAPIVETDTVADLAAMAEPAAWLPNGRPAWAQQPFECLLFKVGGLQLAAPLVELGSIYPLAADDLTSIFGQTQWFMGLLPVKEYNVRAMDTALVVMPERYNAAMRDNYRYVVTLFGSDWGLAVDAVVGTVLLDPAHIRWRGERGKRPWLAGTLIDQMCALFDIAQLAWLFHNQDRKRAPA